MKLSNGIRKALLVSMAVLLAGSLVFTGCKGSDDSSDPIRQMILLQQIENAKTLQQKIDESGAVLDLGGAVKANDAVISKAMTLKNVNLGGKTLTVKASGVVLEGVKSAKIVVSKDIADGEFTMKNCEGIEKLTVNGGGSNSVHIEGSVVHSLAVAKAGVRIALEGKSRIESAAVKADGIILVGNAESTVAKVALASGVRSLALAGGTIEKIVSKTAVKLQIQGNGTKINQVKSSAAVQFEKADDVNDFEEVAIEALDDEDWDDADFEGWDGEDPEDEDGEDSEEEPVYQITSLVKPFSDAAWITNVYGSGVAADFVKGEQLKVAVTQADMDLVKYSNGIQAKHDITDVIADGKTYIVRFYITADVDAKAKWSVMSGEPDYQWYGGADLDLVAGERQKVEGLVDLNSSAASDAFLPSLKTTLGLDFLSVANFTVENIEFGEYTVVEVESVSLNETAKTIFVGEEFELAATVAPENATFKKVTWSSSDPAVATVESGKVKAVAHGKATITAKAGEREATCEVTVAEFSLSETSRTIEPGASFDLAAIVYPEGTEVTWTSSNEEVAVYENGKVIGKAEGTAKITATAMGKTLECEVTVDSNVIPVESVAFAEDGTTINVGDEIYPPIATVTPPDATNKNVSYTISEEDQEFAKIVDEKNEDGKIVEKIVGLKAGTATLTATAEDKTATFTITVEEPILADFEAILNSDVEAGQFGYLLQIDNDGSQDADGLKIVLKDVKLRFTVGSAEPVEKTIEDFTLTPDQYASPAYSKTSKRVALGNLENIPAKTHVKVEIISAKRDPSQDEKITNIVYAFQREGGDYGMLAKESQIWKPAFTAATLEELPTGPVTLFTLDYSGAELPPTWYDASNEVDSVTFLANDGLKIDGGWNEGYSTSAKDIPNLSSATKIVVELKFSYDAEFGNDNDKVVVAISNQDSDNQTTNLSLTTAFEASVDGANGLPSNYVAVEKTIGWANKYNEAGNIAYPLVENFTGLSTIKIWTQNMTAGSVYIKSVKFLE